MKTAGQFDADKAYSELRNRYNLAFADLLIQNGFTVYLFGGSLRDMVMGKEWKDADIRAWIPLPPKERDEKIEEVFAKAHIDIKSKIIFNDSFTIYRFLPENSKADGVIDFTVVSDQWLVGPDFTINGLYFDLGTKELIDKHDALRDIENKLIRTSKDPDLQFTHEPQMIYRAVKCACQFGFEIEKNTLEAMKKHAKLTEGILTAVADDMFPGMTEWFIGNIFRGIKYNPALFEKLWNETGLYQTFTHFLSQRLNLSDEPRSSSVVFQKDAHYEYEEALSLFLSKAARDLSRTNSEETFVKILDLLRLNRTSEYGDFVVDQGKISYKSS